MPGRDLFDGLLRTVRRYRPPPPIPRLVRPSIERFEAFHRASLPLRLDGLVDDWPGLTNWSLPRLRARFADRKVSVIPTKQGRTKGDARTGIAHESVRFGDYIDRLERGVEPEGYLAAGWLPELNDDAPPLDYCRDAPWQVSRFWLGAPQTSTLLHREMLVENLFVQLVGRKRFYLYSPAATPWLYSYPLRSALPNYSRFDPEQPDYEQFPRSRAVQPLEVILEPGDALYLPSRWWHQVRSLDVSVSFNVWWAVGTHSLVVRAVEFARRVRQLGDDSYGHVVTTPSAPSIAAVRVDTEPPARRRSGSENGGLSD